MSLTVTISNEAHNEAHQITNFRFPTTPDKLREALNRLDFAPADLANFSFTDIDYANHDEETAETGVEFPEILSLTSADHLNHLAKIIDELSDDDLLKLFSVYEYASNNTTAYPFEDMDDMIDIVHNLDKFSFYFDVENTRQLSDHIIQASAIDAEDARQLLTGQMSREQHGRNVMASEHGAFVTWGYVGGGEDFEPFVMDNGIPQADRIWTDTVSPLLPENLREAFQSFKMPEIPHEEICDGHTGIASLRLARDVAENVAGGHDHGLLGGVKAKAATIIEIAEMIESGDTAAVAELLDGELSMLNPPRADELRRCLNDYEGELRDQMDFELGIAYDPEKIGDFADVIAQYPPTLHEDANFLDRIMTRAIYEKKVKDMEGWEDRGFQANTTPEEIRAFQLLPSDVQVSMETQHDTAMQYQGVLLENAKKMVDTYNRGIDKTVRDSMPPAARHEEPGRVSRVKPRPARQSIKDMLDRFKKSEEQRGQDPGSQNKDKEPDR